MTSTPNDFAAEVLAKLIKRKVTFRGVQPSSLEIFANGACKVWFMGEIDGQIKRSGITIMNESDIDKAVHFGNPEVIAEICERLIDHTQSRFC